jgi:hypothetical protein
MDPFKTDDKLLHEMVWAAEEFITQAEHNGTTLSPRAADAYVGLKTWCKKVHRVWGERHETEAAEKALV